MILIWKNDRVLRSAIGKGVVIYLVIGAAVEWGGNQFGEFGSRIEPVGTNLLEV